MTDNEIKAQNQAKAEAGRDALIAELRNRTALGRLAHAEVSAAFDLIAELGFSITKAP